MTENYANTPLPELETLLRSGNLPPERRQAVEAELNRRYAQQWGTPATPPPPPPPVAPPPQWGPPPVPAAPVKTSSVAKPVGCLVAVLVAAVAAVLFAVLDDQSPPAPRIGSVCVVPGGGTCPMREALPVGASCVCSNGYQQINGVVA